MTNKEFLPSPHRALSLPEVLVEVFRWIDADDDFVKTVYNNVSEKEDSSTPEKGDEEYEWDCLYQYRKQGVLARCSQVNKLWFAHAVRFLWRNITTHDVGFWVTLPCVLAGVEKSRRQVYANHIESATIPGVEPGEEAVESDGILDGLEFPRLTTVEMYLKGFGQSAHIPKIGKNRVKILELDPSFDVYPDTFRVSQEEMDRILDQVPERFPDLEEIDIIDQCLAYPGALERCENRLPKLKSFRKSLVRVIRNAEDNA